MVPKPGKVNTSFRPMKCREAIRALKNLGFEETSQSGSHVHWKMIRNGVMRKVTLDCHRGEVKANDVRSMISQAGVSKKEWWSAASDDYFDPEKDQGTDNDEQEGEPA